MPTFEIEVDWHRFQQFIPMHSDDIDLAHRHLVINLDGEILVEGWRRIIEGNEAIRKQFDGKVHVSLK